MSILSLIPGFGGRADEEELELNRQPLPKVKDLDPENRKRRVLPPKPWGMHERLWVLVALAVTIGASSILALTAREFKLPGLPRISFPALVLPSLKSEPIILVNDKATPVPTADAAKSKAVVGAFSGVTKGLSGVYAMYVVDLASSASYGTIEKETFEAASLIKLPLMSMMYSESENGRLDLETKYTLADSDKIGGSGSLAGKPAGTTVTYRKLIEYMGQQSDNTAFNIARHVMGDEKINTYTKNIGMTHTSLANNLTTPEDVGLYFEKLWNGKLINSANRDQLLGYLTDTWYEKWLAAGVPEGVRVAHKYGREAHVVNDAGIIYAPKPFVLVILSKGVVETQADENFPAMVRAVYQEIVK